MESQSVRPAVFLDRDGTLIEEKSYLTRVEQVRLLPGVAAALARLRLAGFCCVVVTNQSAIGRGMMTERDLEQIHRELRRQLHQGGADVDAIYHCPAGPDEEHPERKPAPGMLLRAAGELGLDLARSWMVGDQLRDAEAGQRAGCRDVLLVGTGHPVDAGSLRLLPDLGAAADVIIAAHQASADSAA